MLLNAEQDVKTAGYISKFYGTYKLRNCLLVYAHWVVNKHRLTSQISVMLSLWRMKIFLEINLEWDVVVWSHAILSTVTLKTCIYIYIYIYRV